MDRMLDYESSGCKFESCRAHKREEPEGNADRAQGLVHSLKQVDQQVRIGLKGHRSCVQLPITFTYVTVAEWSIAADCKPAFHWFESSL